jgi:hypothetical protein
MRPAIYRVMGYVGILVVLGLVFAMYTRPDFMFNLANQVWGCF